jgi:hypothetical protein
MTGLFDQIKLLFEQQLYTNVVTLVSFNSHSFIHYAFCQSIQGQNPNH